MTQHRHRIFIAAAIIVVAGVIVYLAFPGKANRDAELPIPTKHP